MTDERERLAGIAGYARLYAANYGFEAAMVAARRRLLLELLTKLRPRTVVEVGCGTELLSLAARRQGLSPERWLIVEASGEFARQAREQVLSVRGIEVIEGFAEHAVEKVREGLPSGPELVICSSLLHEVPDSRELLGAVRAILGRGGGVLHVNVPNALSLHRRLARGMGLLGTESDLSERNRLLAQREVFDAASLDRVISEAGFSIRERGGYLVKPFTHEQMAQLPFLDEAMLDGLFALGRELPEIASEIFVNAEVAP
jgi:SAM-dependent methyltransferase